VDKGASIQFGLPGEPDKVVPVVHRQGKRRGRMKTYSADEFARVWLTAKAACEQEHPLRPAKHREIFTRIGISRSSYWTYLNSAGPALRLLESPIERAEESA
jgi:hypothetical protein